MADLPATRRFTAREFYRMAEAGILGEDDRVELIEGEIVQMSPISSRHSACVGRLNWLFSARAGESIILRVRDPVLLTDYLEPESDLALVKRRADFYAEAHPGPADILLIVEVADTSLRYDRETKLPLYARSGIPEAWLVDGEHDRIEAHREPTDNGYRLVQTYRRGERLSVAALPELELTVEAILG